MTTYILTFLQTYLYKCSRMQYEYKLDLFAEEHHCPLDDTYCANPRRMARLSQHE